MMNTYATEFLRAGIGLIPIKNREKTPADIFLPRDEHDGATWEPFKTRLPSPADLDLWFSASPNYGVVTGWRGLIVLDFDDVSEYSRWRLWATLHGGVARMTAEQAFQVQSSRGVHVYLRSEQPGANRKAGKIDIKFRGYVLGPGSIHPSGAEYRALRSTLMLPMIQQLTDVLPAEILVQANIPSNTPVKPLPLPAGDPWQSAMQPAQAGQGSAIDRIKTTMRVETCFTHLQPTSRDGRWFITQCPFHDDHKPSFWVDTQQQLCGCFRPGCTSRPLDVINLYSRVYGLDNRAAIGVLVNQVGHQSAG